LDNHAPIVLFVYNRPWHTQQTIEALQKNELAKESELFIYSDEAKNDEDKKSVNEVREYICNIDGFKNVNVIKQSTNQGLANSIIKGVTEIVNKYGKIIVLEDDLVTSPYFLKFMNEALKRYKDEKKVWHISGWNYPIDTDELSDTFFWRYMNCWGWATWSDRWQHYEKNIDKTIKAFSKDDVERFNLDGTVDFWNQVLMNKKGKINTWAIFWATTIFQHNGLCLNPSKTFVINIGQDGSGLHSSDYDIYKSALSMNNNIKFSSDIIENNLALQRIQAFFKSHKKTFLSRVINKLSKILLGRTILR
jgi:sulfatase maturation enzyme AslB (radical SAM superfamily)